MGNEYYMWITKTIVIAVILTGLYIIAAYALQNYRRKNRAPKEPKDALREDVTRINKILLDYGMNYDGIMDFWEDCFAEAEIRHKLPPCTCEDVNQCETWCQAKARFTLNPPEN
jgi:hypothetical protein